MTAGGGLPHDPAGRHPEIFSGIEHLLACDDVVFGLITRPLWNIAGGVA